MNWSNSSIRVKCSAHEASMLVDSNVCVHEASEDLVYSSADHMNSWSCALENELWSKDTAGSWCGAIEVILILDLV